MSPKRRTLLSLVFACICLSKSLLINILVPSIIPNAGVIYAIAHFTVICFVTWPLNGSEATGVDLFSFWNFLFSHLNHFVLVLASFQQNGFVQCKNWKFCMNSSHRPGL